MSEAVLGSSLPLIFAHILTSALGDVVLVKRAE